MAKAWEDITNYVQLTEDIGTSGQPGREQFQSIAGAGFGAVVNLALPTSDHAVSDEGSLVTGLGMSYHHIPVKFDDPTIANLREFIGVMRSLEGTRVWVHCVVNARVSAFLYHYLKHVRGLDETSSRSPVFKRWDPQMDETWKAFMALSAEDIGL